MLLGALAVVGCGAGGGTAASADGKVLVAFLLDIDEDGLATAATDVGVPFDASQVSESTVPLAPASAGGQPGLYRHVLQR